MFAPKLTTRFTATLAATLCLAAATPAFADTFESNGRQVAVVYSDLDLTKSEDKAELQRRLRRAAKEVCPYHESRAKEACQKLTLRNVREPVATAIAKAETNARYADARTPSTQVGN